MKDYDSIQIGKLYQLTNAWGRWHAGTCCLFVYREYMSFGQHLRRIADRKNYDVAPEDVDFRIFGWSMDFFVGEEFTWSFHREYNDYHDFFVNLELVPAGCF